MAATKSPSRTLLIAGIGFAIACFVILNMVMQRLDPKYQEQMQQEAQRKAQEAQAAGGGGAAAKPQTVSTPGSPGGGGGGNELAALGPEAVLGDKTSPREITVGWQWTPEVQGDPSKVYAAVKQMQEQMKGMKIRVVNVDENPGVLPGISVAGKSVAPLKEDGSLALDTAAMQGIASAVRNTNKPK